MLKRCFSIFLLKLCVMDVLMGVVMMEFMLMVIRVGRFMYLMVLKGIVFGLVFFMNKNLIVLGRLISILMFVVVVIVCWIVWWYMIIVIIVGVFLLIFSKVENLLIIKVSMVFFGFFGIEKDMFGWII